LSHEGRARLDAEGLELVLEGVGDELAAVVIGLTPLLSPQVTQ
jgi:hypothetical protein